MRAQLNSQSLLTGLLYIQLDFFPDTAINLADIESKYIQLPTVPTELERLTRELESVNWAQLANDMKDIAAGINQFISNEDFQNLPAELRSTLASYEALSTNVQQLLSTSGPKLDRVLDSTGDTLEAFNAEIPKLSGLAQENLNLLDDALLAFQETMMEIEALVSAESATTYELNKALRELAQAGRALQLLAKTLEEQPEALIRGKSEEKQ
jgi:paraquat-inducible protein B